MHFPLVSIVRRRTRTSKSASQPRPAPAPRATAAHAGDINPILTAMTRVSVLWSQITSVLERCRPRRPRRAARPSSTRGASRRPNLNVLRTRSIADARLRAMRDAAANALQAKLAVVDQLMPLVGTKVRITINGTALTSTNRDQQARVECVRPALVDELRW